MAKADTTMLPTALRAVCGHDSRSVDDCLHCEAADALEDAARSAQPVQPIDMVLHCPACGMQHIDYREYSHGNYGRKLDWDNPPHRSHLCHGCGHIWRPADVPTNGVAAVKTKGKADSPIAQPVQGVPADDGMGTPEYRAGWNAAMDLMTKAIWRGAVLAARAEPAAPSAEAGRWQPIETAPKDGTLIALSNSAAARSGKWAPMMYGGEWWMSGEFVTAFSKFNPPTHWTALPQPSTDREDGNV